MFKAYFYGKGKEEKRKKPNEPDQEIIKACRRGEVSAFERIVFKYQRQMFNTAFRMIGNYQDAEDAVQNAFVSAYKNIHTFKGSAEFSTWLRKIVINMSLNQIRKQDTLKNKNTVSMEDCFSEPWHKSSVSSPSAQQAMESKQTQQQVQWCINRIAENFRVVLILKDIQGYAYTEICETLSIPKGTVKSKLYRARGSLKKCLKKVYGDLNHVLS